MMSLIVGWRHAKAMPEYKGGYYNLGWWQLGNAGRRVYAYGPTLTSYDDLTVKPSVSGKMAACAIDGIGN
jgi:hypothetical protein